MKILELRFKNLNSLYGDWLIDFTDPEYVSNGIFALTGPTGAGKSTVLDAICLALYGATPRLGKITKGTNEIMSRGTGECYAEVLFESQSGRFRCHWGQHRAHKKPDGDLQAPRHEIAEAQGPLKVIESQVRRVATVIEEKTGMDFDRFTRSILLAQGGFDTFLKADAEQKSRILEQITGTEVYSEISLKVHERRKYEGEKLSVLQAGISGIIILEPEQERAIEQQLKIKHQHETDLVTQVAETLQAIAWLRGIDGLKKEISALIEAFDDLKSERKAFEPDRERLNRALRAAQLDGGYATLTAIRREQDADKAALDVEETKRPELESLVHQKEEALKDAEHLTFKAKKRLKASAPLLQKIRSLDQTLSDKKETVLRGEKDCKKDVAQVESYQKELSETRETYHTAFNQLKQTLKYLETNSRDEWLVRGLAGIQEQFGNLLSAQKDISGIKTAEKEAAHALKGITQKLATHTKEVQILKKEAAHAGIRIKGEKETLGVLLGDLLLREYRTKKETLLREMAFIRKIAALEDHRTKLEDGKPCPLCGSKEHPFARGNVPLPDEIEKKIDELTKLIGKAEDLESRIRKLEEKEKDAFMHLTEREKLESADFSEKKGAEKNLTDIHSQLVELEERYERQKGVVFGHLTERGFHYDHKDAKSIMKDLKSKMESWQDQVTRKAGMEKQIFQLEGELKRLDAVIETEKKALNEKQTAVASTRKAFENGVKKRSELFGNKSPDTEEKRLNKGVTDAEFAEKGARTVRDETLQTLLSTRTSISSLYERIEKRVFQLKCLESQFLEHLRSAGFNDENDFRDAVLPPSRRDALKSRAKDLDDRLANLKARQDDRLTRLASEKDKKLTNKTLGTLETENKDLEENLKQLRDTIAGLKHRLLDNSAAKERVREKQALIEHQKEACHRWEKLHGLIGSADGKKYRNFAQGLTFELMVSHANRQLEKMTDRYLLIRHNEQPLELNVVDNYQAGEIRSTKNLSGGESFIVSLSLALGLSQMASRNVRVDSLFLDEGFGTLDEEALETSLETLASLRQDGKIIGVISHVPALKERIPTQIDVNPLSGGKSAVAGPGVRKNC